MKFKGSPQQYWVVQQRKIECPKTKEPGKWHLIHSRKVYWTYQVAKDAVKEFEKIASTTKNKYHWMYGCEFRIVRLEVIGVEECLEDLKTKKDKANEKQLEAKDSNKTGFITWLSKCPIGTRISGVLRKVSIRIQAMVSRKQLPGSTVNN